MSTDLAVVEAEAVLTRSMEPVPLDRHPAAVYLAGLSAGSRRTMRQALDLMADLLTGGIHDADTLPWSEVRYQHTALLRSELAARYSPATANKCLAALRGTLRECWRLGYVDAETYQRAIDLKGVRGVTLPKGRALTSGEIHALASACRQDRTATGRRDAALLAVLWTCGLRRQEAAALDLADYDPQSGELKVQRGKGGKARLTYLANGASAALAAWLEVRGAEPGPLFLATRKGGTVLWRRLTDQAIYDAMRKLADRAGVTRFSPHDLRRSFVSDLLDAGADIATVQHLAGHANIQTTARYDRRGERAKAKAAALRHFPFQAVA